MKTLFCDLETFSPIDLKKCGTHAYAEQAEILLFGYAVDDEPVKVLDFTEGDTCPPELYEEDVMTVWHNSHFDRTVMRHALNYELPLSRTHDTMARALSHGLQGSLEKLCDVLKVSQDKAKDKRGKQLIQLFCKPRPKNMIVRRATKETHPKEWEEFKEYARLDIEAMREVYRKLPLWNYKDKEKELWNLDQVINARGFQVDVDLAEHAVKAIEKAQEALSARAFEATNGKVDSANQRDALLFHILKEYGVTIRDLTKSTVERLLADERTPEGIKILLKIRAEASTSSTSKYKKLLSAVSSDGRLRGTIQFAGASRTLRFAGRMFQPQNLPRPTKKNKEINSAIELIKYDMLDYVYEEPMSILSDCIRGCITAKKGYKLCVSDLSNIEGRAAVWLSGEEWKLEAFRNFDAGTGPDMYCLAYAKSFNINPKDVTKEQRQVGKVQELALQYGGGVGAFVSFALLYRIDLEALANLAWVNIPERIKTESKEFWEWSKKEKRTLGLSERVFIVCDSLKRLWREAHPAICSYWWELGGAIKEAINNPCRSFKARSVTVRRDGSWLRLLLPSGLYLCYPSPKMEDAKSFSYQGVDQFTRQWTKINSYGPKVFENVTQAFAREVMTANMPAIDASGYPIILSVHDELLTEPKDLPEFNAKGLSAMMSTVPDWCQGLPLAAAGFEAYRYKKE